MNKTQIVVLFCIALGLSAAGAEIGFGQDVGNGDAPKVSVTKSLVKVATARVEQCEIRRKAIVELSKMDQQVAQIRIQHAKTLIDTTRSKISASESQHELRQAEFKRFKQLVENAAVSQAKLHEAERNLVHSHAMLEHARSELRQVETNLDAANLELKKHRWESVLREADATIDLLNAQAELIRIQTRQK